MILSNICALLTIAFGAFGFLAPRYTLGALDLATTTSTMGLSEMRASVGGLFVVLGAYALATQQKEAFFFIGIAFVGAALGRVVSLVFDNPPFAKVAVFGGIEIALAVTLILLNRPA
ncbi:MAG: DUF4345 family protein [Pseudomonadota bacterium]